jgi:hypothetical protein
MRIGSLRFKNPATRFREEKGFSIVDAAGRRSLLPYGRVVFDYNKEVDAVAQQAAE